MINQPFEINRFHYSPCLLVIIDLNANLMQPGTNPVTNLAHKPF